MAIEYERHLRKDYGDELVDWFEANWRKVDPIKDWKEVIEMFETL